MEKLKNGDGGDGDGGVETPPHEEGRGKGNRKKTKRRGKTIRLSEFCPAKEQKSNGVATDIVYRIKKWLVKSGKVKRKKTEIKRHRLAGQKP